MDHGGRTRAAPRRAVRAPVRRWLALRLVRWRLDLHANRRARGNRRASARPALGGPSRRPRRGSPRPVRPTMGSSSAPDRSRGQARAGGRRARARARADPGAVERPRLTEHAPRGGAARLSGATGACPAAPQVTGRRGGCLSDGAEGSSDGRGAWGPVLGAKIAATGGLSDGMRASRAAAVASDGARQAPPSDTREISADWQGPGAGDERRGWPGGAKRRPDKVSRASGRPEGRTGGVGGRAIAPSAPRGRGAPRRRAQNVAPACVAAPFDHRHESRCTSTIGLNRLTTRS